MAYRTRLLAALLVAGATAARAADEIQGVAGPYGERLSIGDKGLVIAFPDDVEFKIGGRIQTDAGAVGLSRPDLPGFSDNVAVRRAWIEPQLKIGRDWVISFQYDLNTDVRPINNALISWKGLSNTILTFGNMKEPISMEWLMDNSTTVFAERSLANALVPDRRFGFAAGHHGENWTLTAGVYGAAASDGITGDGVAGAVRATWAPILRDDEVLHFGASGNYRSRGRDDIGFGFSSRAEAFLFARPYLDTGTIGDTRTVTRVGGEFGYANGPFLLQAEYLHADVARFDGRPELSFQGGYVQGSVVLNGPPRTYVVAPGSSTAFAIWSGVHTPDDLRVSHGGPGVFELAARFSTLDLDDRALFGGRETDVTVGLSWYPEPYVRVIADYVHGEVRPSASGNRFGVRPFDADTFISRLQFYW